MNQKKDTVATASIITIFIICFSGLGCGIYTALTVNHNQTEQYIFQYINQERADRGLPILKLDTDLNVIAKDWSNSIAETKNIQHGDFETRLQTIGLPNTKYTEGKEIIASFSNTWVTLPLEDLSSENAQKFIDLWLNSPSHKEAMLTPSSGYMGIGVTQQNLAVYGVVDFKFE